MKYDDNFDIDSFISPDVCHAPIYVWVWNDICSHRIIDEQLDEMKNLGIRAFYILPEPKNFRPDTMPTNLAPDYLSDEFFELCAYAIKKSKELGMLCWIYDEGGWPSGGACGRVLRDHPEYAREILKVCENNFLSGDIYKKSRADILASFLEDGTIIDEGYKFTHDCLVTEYTTEKSICSAADYPDLLNKKSTEHFIETTHEKYASALKNFLGKNVTAVFTDEPKASASSFSKELADKYESIYGESILPHLPLILHRAEVTQKNVHILHRWYDLCSRVFCDNFLLTCKKWANEQGIAFTGHMDMDHSPLGCMRGGGNFNIMRALRCFDIPGVDVIWRQLYPENKTSAINDMNAYNGFFPRYASSAAAQNGTKLAMSEIFGVAGSGITYDVMRFTVGYQVVRGINVFNPFNFPLGRKGALLTQELPVFTEGQVFCRHLPLFNRYVERLSYLASVGERVCETGLYYPVSDFQGGLNADKIAGKFDTLGRKLEDMIVDFDIIDDDVIRSAEITDDGCLRIGRAVYKNIIIPDGAFIPRDSQKALKLFTDRGGRVTRNLADLSPLFNFEGEGLRAMHRKAKNADLFFLFREKGEKGEYRVQLPSSEGYLLNLMTGKLKRLKAKDCVFQLSLQIGETAVVLLTNENLNADDTKNFRKILEVADGFSFCKELELSCGENGFESIRHCDNPVPVNLGDWAYLIGNSYSGSGIYETVFSITSEDIGKEGSIDLGDVRFSAEVYLNANHLGTALMPPYRFKIPADVIDKNNKLKIIITNTSANWYTHTDYFDKHSIKDSSPYFEAEQSFAKDFVSGGLYGPVEIYIQDD